MKTKSALIITFLAATTFAVIPSTLTADESTAPSDTRYGLFNWLDHRSQYGTGPYPEPFIVDDTILEVNEARLDWLHTETPDGRGDNVKAEIEKGFGLMTAEVEVPFEYDKTRNPSETTDGFENIDLGARYPVYQFVSDSELIDTTLGAALEVGIPTHSSLSKDTEVVPKIFDDLQIGEHFTLQSIAGLSMLCGSDDDNGSKAFEYGFVFGYSIPRGQWPLPYVLQFLPVFELSGETALNHGKAGLTSLTGNAGFRANLKPIGTVQPRLGVGYVFPIENNAREELHWGVITSLVFEY
ncbi:MAG TPA: hypothetical protein VLZ30_07010 [Verrucomicrobiae bacterium]|nr:hypothetical protein [Verrucomicrobiae bacterium]